MNQRDYFEELRDKTFAKAKADGYEIILPRPNELQLDIDQPWPFILSTIKGSEAHKVIHHNQPKIISVLYRMQEEFSIRSEAWKSAGGNCHAVLSLTSDLDPVQRIALQSILGSDPMRELLNLRRVLCGAEDPIALFRPQAKPIE